MVFSSERQRRGFFANRGVGQTTLQPSIIAFSYITPNKRLGEFKNIKEVFTRFPSEKKAFDRVMKFRRTSGIRVNTTQEIKEIQRMNKRTS